MARHTSNKIVMATQQKDRENFASLLRQMRQISGNKVTRMLLGSTPAGRPTTVLVVNKLSQINKILFRQLTITGWATRPPIAAFEPLELNYVELLNIITSFIDILPEIVIEPTGHEMLLETLKHVACLLPVEALDSLLCTTASALGHLPASLREQIMDCLCDNILPISLIPRVGSQDQSFAEFSVSLVIMSVLQHCPEVVHHVRLIETLMMLKDNVCEDLLEVIGNGVHTIRGPAVKLLFYFWPIPTGTSQQELELGNAVWKVKMCQVTVCPTPENRAVKMCLDPMIAAELGNAPPPLYICSSCLYLLEEKGGGLPTIDITVSQGQASGSMQRHRGRRWLDGGPMSSTLFDGVHAWKVVQKDIPDPWSPNTNLEQQANLLQTICQLLLEASPAMFGETSTHSSLSSMHDDEDPDEPDGNFTQWPDHQNGKPDQEDRRILSKYGIMLMKHKCTPPGPCDPMFIGQLIAAVIQWLHDTRKMPEGPVGACLGPLKHTQVKDWLTVVCETNFDVLCQCLEPEPPMFARVGGCWNTLTSYVTKHKEGLGHIFIVITENIFSFDKLMELWQHVMPSWMDAVKGDISLPDLTEFKTVFRDLFPMLSISDDHKYEFIHQMFRDTGPLEQGQAIFWLQNMTRLEVYLPKLDVFFLDGVRSRFAQGVETAFPFSHCPVQRTGSTPPVISPSAASLRDPHPVSAGSFKDGFLDINTPYSRYVLMLDLLVEQRALRDPNGNVPFDPEESSRINKLLTLMLNTKWGGEHKGNHSESYNDCNLCQCTSLWFQLAYQLLRRTCHVSMVASDTSNSLYQPGTIFGATVRLETWSSQSSAHLPVNGLNQQSHDTDDINPEAASSSKNEDGTGNEVSVSTVGVDSTEEQDIELKTLQDQDESMLLMETRRQPSIKSAEHQELEKTSDAINKRTSSVSAQKKRLDYAHTGLLRGKELFSDMPVQVKLLIGCLTKLEAQRDVDVMCSIVKCIEVLCLQGNCLTLTKDYDVELLRKIQEGSLIPNLWHALRSEHSYLSEACVPVLVHCLSYPYAAEMLWKELNEAFNHDDWRVRFNVVEKVVVLGRFLKEEDVKMDEIVIASSVMSTLALAFSRLIEAMEDVCPAVATRAILLLKTIKTSSLKLLFSALEHQFRFEARDRPLILQRMQILNNMLPNEPILTVKLFVDLFQHLKEEATHLTDDAYDGLSRRVTSMKRSFSVMNKTTYQQKARASSLPTATMPSGFLSSKFEELQGLSFSSHDGSLWKSWDATLDEFVGIVLNSAHNAQTSTDGGKGSQFVICAAAGETSQHAIKHQLITLLMQFMTNHSPHQSEYYAFGGKLNPLHRTTSLARTKSIDSKLVTDLQSFFGYQTRVNNFNHEPSKLRLLPEFSAYMFGIADVLDQNIVWGQKLLDFTLKLLLYCPAASRDDVPVSAGNQPPLYSLALLSPSLQSIWLVILIIVVYKYEDPEQVVVDDQENTMTDYQRKIEWLSQIAMNTISRPSHVCPHRFLESSLRQQMTTEDIISVQSKDLVSTSSSYASIDKHHSESSSSSNSLSKSALGAMPAPTHNDVSRPHRVEGANVDLKGLNPILEDDATSLVSSTSESKKFQQDPRSSLKKSASQRPKWTTMAEVGRRPSIVMFSPETKGGLEDESDSYEGTKSSRHGISEDRQGTSELSESETWSSQKGMQRRYSALSSSSTISSTSSSVSYHGNSLVGLGLSSTDIVGQRSMTEGMFSYHNIERICPGCEGILEGCNEEVACLALIAIGTFTHRYREHSATMLQDILDCMASMATTPLYPWQSENSVLVTPSGSSVAVARQFLRCILLQFAGYGLFQELFRSENTSAKLIKAIAVSLPDKGAVPINYPGLTLSSPIYYIMENFSKHMVSPIEMMQMISNVARYIENLLSTASKSWQDILSLLQRLFRNLPDIYQMMDSDVKRDYLPAMKLMICSLQAAKSTDLDRSLLGPFSKLLSQAIADMSISVATLWAICSRCYTTKDRDKLTRVVTTELELGLRFKKEMKLSFMLNLVKFVCVDSGAYIGEVVDLDGNSLSVSAMAGQTGAQYAVQYILPAAATFLGDKTVYSKQHAIGNVAQQLKTAVAQMIGIELYYQSDEALQKILPWLRSRDASINNVNDVANHLVVLSWVLLGAIAYRASTSAVSDAIDIIPFREETSQLLTDQCTMIIQGLGVPVREEVWLARVSLLPLLFELCKLWTVYCEVFFPSAMPASYLSEFWSTVTVSVLNVLASFPIYTDTEQWRRNLPRQLLQPFVCMVDSLQMLSITSLSKLLPRWLEIFSVFEKELAAPLRDYLQDCSRLSQTEVNWDQNDVRLLRWLLHEQDVLANIEVQVKTKT